jgi:hypothetical protein
LGVAVGSGGLVGGTGATPPPHADTIIERMASSAINPNSFLLA